MINIFVFQQLVAFFDGTCVKNGHDGLHDFGRMTGFPYLVPPHDFLPTTLGTQYTIAIKTFNFAPNVDVRSSNVKPHD